MCVHLFFCFFTSRPHLWRISATYPPNRGGRGCSRGSMSSAKSSRKRWIRGKASKQIPCAITNHHHSSRKIKEIIIIDQSVLTCPILINVDVFLFVTFMACELLSVTSRPCQVLFVSFRDALNKMKDVYEKNPQMGDPSSLQPKISETICNMEKLRSEIHKNEVWERGDLDSLEPGKSWLLDLRLRWRVRDENKWVCRVIQIYSASWPVAVWKLQVSEDSSLTVSLSLSRLTDLVIWGGGKAELQRRQKTQRWQPPSHSSRQREVFGYTQLTKYLQRNMSGANM